MSAPTTNPAAPVSGFEADIPFEVARLAHAGTSFVPEERAEQERRSYAGTLERDHAALAALATTDEKRAALALEFERYRDGYRTRSLAWYRSRARCLSTMITGASNFPTRRNEKRGHVADKRLAELTDYRTRALAAIRRALTPEAAPVMTGDADAPERLRAKIAGCEIAQERMKAANAAIRKHAKAGPDAQVAALVACGLSEASAREALKPDFCGRVGFPAYALTNNNANIRRMRDRLTGIERAKATPETVTEGGSATIEDCPPDNRVRLFFPGKPEQAVRERLKRGGFRWTPTLGCWQAYRNVHALALAKEIAS